MFSLAVAGLLNHDDIPDDFPLAEELRANSVLAPFNGGSGLAGPDGTWLIEPVADREGLIVADVPLRQVSQERLTFDPTSHYARPDVFHSTVNRRRSQAVWFFDDMDADAADHA